MVRFSRHVQLHVLLKQHVLNTCKHVLSIFMYGYPGLSSSQLLLLPKLEDSPVYTGADPATQATLSQCYDATVNVNPNLRTDLGCLNYGYSIMTELSGGAVCEYYSLYNSPHLIGIHFLLTILCLLLERCHLMKGSITCIQNTCCCVISRWGS